MNLNMTKKSAELNIDKPLTAIYVISVFCIILLFPLSRPFASEFSELKPLPEYRKRCIHIINSLEDNHYLEKELDDSMSSVVLDRYIKRLDPAKMLFTLEDISKMNRHRFKLDDQLKRGNLSSAFEMFNLFYSRSQKRFEYILSLIPDWKNVFNFKGDDYVIVDPDFRERMTDVPDLYELWKKDIKNHIILMLLEGEDENKISERLEKTYKNRLKRLLQTNSDDVFEIFINSVTTSYDPHTQYMAPKLSEEFDIGMSHSLEGIGALLQTEYEYTKVVRLIPKGPADKSKLLMPGDKIIGVGQGKKGEIIDVLGQRIDYVVRLIRGPKNTIVTLKIIPVKETTSTRTIHIKRDTVKLEDKAAKKKIITIEHGNQKYKLGIIEIPQFYVDFEGYKRGDKNYKSLARDVRVLLEELKKEKIDGLIVDLRDNGGGSLDEARKVTGLFIKSGPIVQIKGKTFTERLYDNDRKIVYSGPLMVMINRMSASASEIFTGAIKDYNRGVIVGSRTFGKGTVQQLLRIGRGNIKMTSSKFYRISGASTQNLGVLPDIKLPQLYKVEDTGESSLDLALPWDTTNKTFYWSYPSLDNVYTQLKKKFQKRAIEDPGVIYLNKRIQMTAQINEQKKISLNLEKRKNRKSKFEKMEQALKDDYLSSTGVEKTPEKEQENTDDNDKDKIDIKSILMNQAHFIMADFIDLSNSLNFSW